MKAETEILKKATRALKEQTGLSVTYKYISQKGSRSGYFIDVALELPFQHKIINYVAEVNTRVNDAVIGSAVIQAKQTSNRFALVGEYVTQTQADKMRELNITFFDTAGNAYVNDGSGLYVFVSGRKSRTKEEKPLELFSPTGIKLLLALLTTPRLETFDYRTISDATQVPRTSIGRVMNGLEKAGYLTRRGKQTRFLTNKKDLIKRWVEAYSESYRSKLKPIRYHSTKSTGRWWEGVDITEYNAVWGGETGGQRLTKYLKPQTATVYADSNLTRLQALRGLVRDENGEVEILRKFWTSGEVKNCAPPLVVYADLVATADERNLEIAQMIYDEYLTPLTKENP